MGKVAYFLFGLGVLCSCAGEAPDERVEFPISTSTQAVTATSLTTIDSAVTGYGTFQSHNQKVVVTRYGTFLTYAKTPYDYVNGVTWRLMRSTNGGTSFQTLWEQVQVTHPPAIEAASDGTIYLVRTNEGEACAPAYFYRLSPMNSFGPEQLARVCLASAQKFSLLLDEARGFLYYVGHTFSPNTPLRFVKLALDGSVVADYQLSGAETFAQPSYPNLVLSDGVIYLAWTTGKLGGDNNDYYSIHVARSSDAGSTWRSLSGAALTIPFRGDQGGQATEVTIAAERLCTTWLSSFAVIRGKAHFVYRRVPNASEPECTLPMTTRYRRFDTTTGRLESDISNFAPADVPFSNLDGFFAVSPRDATLFFTSRSTDNRIVTVGTANQGASWTKEAESIAVADSVYAVGGQRLVTSNAQVAGSYTDSMNGAVRFFQAGVTPAPTLPSGVRLASAITASSSASGYPIYLANDNDPNTTWLANLAPVLDNNNAWVSLDFGEVKYVSRLKYLTGIAPYPACGPANYVVETSIDGLTWQNVGHFAAPSGWQSDADIVVDGPARYLRLTTSKVNDGTGWALAFREIWAEGGNYPTANSARRQNATIAVSQAASGYPAIRAIDRSNSTLWLASLNPVPANNSAWVTLDLGVVKHVTRLRWLSAQGTPYPASGPSDYLVETSIDGESYASIVVRTNAAAVAVGDEIVDRNARFVRLRTSKVNDGTGWALSFKEIWTE